MTKLSKAQADARRRYDKNSLYPAHDALELVKTLAHSKFDESVDAVFQLGIDARKADQLVRGTVSLPHGIGKEVRVLVFAESDNAKAAEEAGADIVGGKELAEELGGGGPLEFDIAIATPDMMPHVGKLGPILGPRGLMPNPKSGTVTPDVGKAVEEFKAGRVEYRNDRYGNVHVPVGRVSFEVEALVENFGSLSDELLRARPASAKGRFIRKVAVSSTMGPGVRIDPSDVETLVKELH
ncbi:MAG TPA: 50S ribosomal protein L1 [Acidimicrobiia bacterium]|jgi:large subunit ribosomal protein L1|nr:50S ribosomal protein L1 [Acidimicrobiia bacterium]